MICELTCDSAEFNRAMEAAKAAIRKFEGLIMARAIPRRTTPRTTTAFVSRQQEQWRGNASERGYDEAWKRVAAQRREMDENLCQHCLKEGGLAQAMESLARSTHAQPVDHIVPLHVRPDWRLELSNLQTLCVSHNKKKSDIDIQMYGSASMDEIRLTSSQRINRLRAAGWSPNEQ